MKMLLFQALVSALVCRFPLLAQSGTSKGSIPDVPIEIRQSEAAEHFLSGKRLIHSDAPEARGFGFYVDLKLVVTPSGIVESAIPVSGRPEWYTEAIALAWNWHYLPFRRNGMTVYATFSSPVLIVPPERRPAEHMPFPKITDWNSLKITLRRTSCFGSCPSYTLTIFGDGTVVYNGDAYVKYCGEYRGHVSADIVRQLDDVFKQADYFNLFDKYELNATDLPAYFTSISFDDKTKSVLDYAGDHTGMPEAVANLENGIDRLAGPDVWAQGMNSHTECENSFVPTTTSDVPWGEIKREP
jgi:Domain of unknown function (DUF6438)